MLKRAGRYEIVAELGRGGFGHVYRAFDPTLHSMVAIKTLAVDNDAAILARFRNEATASRRLRHPNIVTIYDFGEEDGLPFIVMELLEGQDLQRVISSHQTLPLWHKIQIMTQIASGLAHAHAHGIVHRDVKPANVMLLPDGNVKIMDFGIALVSQDTQNRLTPRGAVIGTFSYMAPEQFRGAQQDARGDIFAYGLMFYELFSGIHPFHADEPATLMYNVINLEPVPIHEVCPDCPEQLQPVIARLLQKDPEFRYQNLEDALFDCEPILLALKRARAHDLFEEARLACGNRQLEAAQALLRQVMDLDPSYPSARDLREWLQTELRRLAVRPRIEALANEAREQLAAGNPAEAVQRFEAAARLDPSDTELKSLLEQAKAALEQSRQVARLVADAERALLAGDLTGAHRIAQQAVEMAPTEARARELIARTQAAMAEQERQARLAENLARVRRLIDIRSWDEASSVLAQLEREFPPLGEIRVLRETLEAGRRADERQQKLTSGLTAARQEIQARSLEAARDRLAALRAEFPDAAGVEQLLHYANSEIEERTRSELVDRTLGTARALVERKRFADAVQILQLALAGYPADPVLQRELRSVSTAQQQAERDVALRQTLDSAKALQTQGRFDEALVPLDAFSSKYGREPGVEELRQAIERDREGARRGAELREMVRRVNELLAQGNAEEATKILKKPPTAIKDHPQITELRAVAQTQLHRQIERAAALDDALASANALRQRNDFDQAAQVLAAFATGYGADPKVAELDRLIQRDREESQRRAEELTRIVGRANDFLAAGKALEATQLLGSPPSYFKDHPDVIRLRKEAELQVRKQAEREAALQTAISAAVSFEQQGRHDDALAPLESFARRYGADDRISAREQAIHGSREEARRAAAIHELATRVRTLLEQDNPRAAVTLLKQEPALVNESHDLRELLNIAETALAARQTREAVEAIVAEARSCLSRGEFQGALDTLDDGLNRFPLHAALKFARAEAAAALAAKQREEYCATAIAEVNSLIARHEYDRARGVLEEALSKLSADPRLLPLGARIEAHRSGWEAIRTEQNIQDSLARAKELLATKPAESVALIEQLSAQYPNRPELTAQLAEAREALRRADERNLIREAERLCDQGQFAEAISKLNQVDRETAEIQAARRNVETRRAAAEIEHIAKAIESARETANRNPSKALRALDKLRREYSQRPEIDEAIEECRAAVRDGERRSVIAEIRSLHAKGRFSKARALHQEAVARFGADADLEEILHRLDESAAAKRLPVGEPAPEPLQPRLARIWVISSLGAVAIFGGGLWVLAHRTPPPAPTPVHVEIRTDPAGASVQVGDRSCVTPNCQFDLSPGRYNAQAQMKGYASAQQTLIVDTTMRSTSADFTLQPLPPPPRSGLEETGTLVVETGLPEVIVLVDQSPSGRTDTRGILSVVLEAKAHSVRVQKTGYEAPRERQVRISKNTSQSIVFSLTPQAAKLELRGAPSGVEVRAGGAPIGRTDGSVFSAPVPPGDQVLRVTEGSASREISQRFEPGGIVTLDWPSIAPARSITPPPPKLSPAEQDWALVSSASDPAQVQTYLEKYPNGPHTAEARSRMEALVWPGVNQNDMESLRAYVNRFPGGSHVRAALSRIADLVWNSVDKNNREAVRLYMEQNPDSPYRSQAQNIFDQFEKRRLDAEDRLKQERAKQADDQKRLNAERAQVLAVLDRLNTAFAQHKQRELKAAWPSASRQYLEAVTAPRTLIKLEAPQTPNITADVATVLCILTAESKGSGPPQPTPVKVTLQKSGSDWNIQSVEANR